ncbi:MAG: beta-galactosidase, partial [Gammaproteobacteria bacterium]|nr:beta-galactosidase [Gammaproteobacteria bacterium]
MTISRRKVLESVALAPALAALWPVRTLAASARSRARSLALRPRAVLIDGEPVYLVMGTVDYYRCPSAEWRERLLQAKRCGLNAIMFCVPWNFHEREEGVFSFSGDTDLGRYLDLCAELGLYAYPRVGPFICAEWDAAGYPPWLYAKRDIELRIDHAPTLVFVRRWFEQLIPLIAQRQVTRGGAVILVQQENEYYFVGRPGIRDYQSFLIDTMRRLGIEVPITDCNGDDPRTRVPGSLMTQNGGGAEAVAKARRQHPDKPAIISELYTDYSTMWGWPVSSFPTSTMVYQQTVETLAAGGMFSYYMFYGGTNFGFWASTTWKSDESFMTTSYYPRAPIAEGGAFNDSFWAVKAANLLARGAEQFLTAAVPAPLPVSLSGPVRGEAVRAPQGHLIFVQPEYPETVSSVFHTEAQGGDRIQTAEEWPFAEIANQAGVMRLPSGASVELAESSARPSMLPFQLQIDPNCRIDYANASFFGVAGQASRRVILLRGEAGRQGVVSING